MVTLNLMPWRVYHKKHQVYVTKIFFYSSAIITFMLIAIVHVLLLLQLKQVSNRVALLKSEWNRVIGHAASQDIISDQSEMVMQESLRHQQMVQRLFVELARQQSPNVCFTEIKDEKSNIVFLGQAYTAADLTEFLKHWKMADLFSEIKLNQLELQKNGLVRFQFRAIENDL